jgi:hypothetical protein
MGTAFSTGLNEDGFSKWLEWEGLFSNGLDEDGFFDWGEWGRLCEMGWMRTNFK